MGRRSVIRALLGVLCLLPLPAFAASFDGNARVEIQDPSGNLSWSNTVNALTVECWFKISVPTGTNISDHMTILVNRRTGAENDPCAYWIRFNPWSGNVEYVTRGPSSGYTNSLIQQPYLDRWYHVAVVRSGSSFTGYADGRQVFNETLSPGVGNSANVDGASIGGWGSTSSKQYLWGEVQEVAIYQSALSQEFIAQYMLQDQPALPELKGYFKLGYSTNASDQLKNLAPTPPTNTSPATVQGATVTFEEVDESGEQSAFDSRRNGGRDALVPLSGSFSWEQSVFSRPVPGIAFDFSIAYASGNSQGGAKLGSYDPYASSVLGKGWRHSFEARIIPGQYFDPVGGVTVLGMMSWNGSLDTWDYDYDLDDGSYKPRHKEYRGELSLPSINRCEWVTPDRQTYKFKHPFFGGNTVMRGRLYEISDLNSNKVQILWNETVGIITQVVDTAGGQYIFNYNPQYLLTNIAFQGWSVNFEYNTNNVLSAKTVTAPPVYSNVNTRWEFTYNATNGLLERVMDPRGNTNGFVVYDKYGRKINVADAIGRSTVTEYNCPAKRQIRHTDPAGYKWLETYDRKGHLISQQDPLTNITTHAYDLAGNRVSVTDPRGNKTTFGYDSRANVLAQTNALGLVKQRAYHPFFNKATNEINELGWSTWSVYDSHGNLATNADGLGTLAVYTYFTNGLVQTAKDGNGNTTQFTYTPDGFLASKTDPATNTWTYGYNNIGWVAAETNPLNEVTSYAYDLNGKVVQKVDPLMRAYSMTYDGNGNLLTQSDAKSQLTRFYYDAANQKTQMTDRAGFSWLFQYDNRGKLWKTTDPLTNTVTTIYDPAGRLISETDPLGNAKVNVYDANNNLVAMVDKLGQRWTKTYDRLNRVATETDPLGNTRITTYDSAGRMKTSTVPKGYVSTHYYDGRGRLTNWVDAEGFTWQYDYDQALNITNITDALGGHYVMTYGPRNERTMERNQDSNEWHYAYDKLLRLEEQTDPNTTVRDIFYDPGGRIDYVSFSTGRSDDYTFDDNNNLTTLTRAGSGAPVTLSFPLYDAMDRIKECTDTFGKTVKYAYDPAGHMTNMTYPDNKTLGHFYDALGRLTNQVDWAGRILKYTYDKANRLLTRTYPNGITQTNAFDSAGRLSVISYQLSGGTNALIALTYAYDRNGNKSDSTEKGTLNWNLPAAYDETARYTASGRLKDKNDALSSNDWTYAYDSSGNMTNAVSPAKSIAFTYDEDNRVTSLRYQVSGVGTQTVTNRYDALGRRVVRILDGVQTKYVLNLIGDMERILCDMNSSGVIQTWYVHGPDLCYAVDTAGNLVCYHADAMGNVVALTDTNKAAVAQYAYTPYGRLLGASTTGTCLLITNNCYTFVGSQGVMAEVGNLYFMRARYYSGEIGVFLSTDPVKKIGPGWKSGPYIYVNANPLAGIDPTGLYSMEDAVEESGGRMLRMVGGALGSPTDLAIAGGEAAAGGVMLMLAVSQIEYQSGSGLGAINPLGAVQSMVGLDPYKTWSQGTLYQLMAQDMVMQSANDVSAGFLAARTDSAESYAKGNALLENTLAAAEMTIFGVRAVDTIVGMGKNLDAISDYHLVSRIKWMKPRAVYEMLKNGANFGKSAYGLARDANMIPFLQTRSVSSAVSGDIKNNTQASKPVSPSNSGGGSRGGVGGAPQGRVTFPGASTSRRMNSPVAF